MQDLGDGVLIMMDLDWDSVVALHAVKIAYLTYKIMDVLFMAVQMLLLVTTMLLQQLIMDYAITVVVLVTQ